jgi:preprotein translocase subunit SecG
MEGRFMVHTILIFIHVLVSVLLIVTVLMQSGKGTGLAGTFGGTGVTGGVFGGRGAAPFLVKATTAFAVLFMLTAITLNFVSPGTGASNVIERALRGNKSGRVEPPITNQMPVAPAAKSTPAVPAAPGKK